MDYERPSNALPTLFDLLTIEPTTSIFFSYARELELSRLLLDLDSKITVLVPTNKAVMALARKPHQDSVPRDNTIKLTEQELDERSKKNVERWACFKESPISLASRTYPTLAEGNISFVETSKDTTLPEWERVLINGDIQIVNAKEAINGVLYVIDGTVQDD
ncbi:hypothetical protein EDB92DRAFT_1934907 [Lactarius akahatsu]|uniref:FAS1 domain-containing protein n=1 Tax=Lactarius akahatsu TaxID=416441 RepID=A0AAD4LHT9_9AGAM|nr:hypothetical protein EDB92DRAFT_1934907 [Lactarius akahatsu]